MIPDKVEQNFPSTLKQNKMLCTVIKQCCEAESICDDKPPSAPLPLSVSSSSPLVSYLHLLPEQLTVFQHYHRKYYSEFMLVSTAGVFRLFSAAVAKRGNSVPYLSLILVEICFDLFALQPRS